MLDSMLASGGDMFIWITCILIAFTAAIVAVDNLPKKKKKEKAG